MSEDDDSNYWTGDLTIARERFSRLAEAVAKYLPAATINVLALNLCFRLDSHRRDGDEDDMPDFKEQWDTEREAEKNGSAAPSSDAEFLAFMKNIGATEPDPRPKPERQKTRARRAAQ